MSNILRCTFAVCLTAATLTGCARYEGDSVEERYRMFFATQEDAVTDINASAEVLAGQYAPSIAVSNSLEELKNEGFEISKIEPITWGDGATVFTFKRRLYSQERADLAPIHFVGAFRTHPEEGEPVYYAFDKHLEDYTLHVFHAGERTTIKTDWVGRELQFNDSQGLHTLQLSPDGDFLFHLLETVYVDGQQHDRTLAVARRMTTEREELTEDDRMILRMEGKIARQTPYGYDVYPWSGTMD